MKRTVLVALCLTCVLAASSVASAQNCSNWTNWDLRGTYTMSGSGYIDLSRVFPGMGFPAGPIPMYWVGAHTYDGHGGGTGWLILNAGGGQMHGKLVGKSYAMQPDCSVLETFSLQIQETGTTIGPFQRIGVPGPSSHLPGGLDLYMILGGSEPGNPAAPGFDIGVAHRISLDPFFSRLEEEEHR
ncbi:MAG: hypothetical protein ABSF23_03515 [Terracidiphilus sp.]